MSRLAGTSYQYLQRSKIPTNKFQKSLPRLGIPKLAKTCERYVAALEPVFQKKDPDSLEKTKAIVADFQKTDGVKLQKDLVRYDKTVKHSSYVSDLWFDMYLSSRTPLPLNFNPFLAWKDSTLPELNNQIVRGTNMLISAMRFKRSIEENVLDPEIFSLNPKKPVNPETYRKVLSLTPEAIAFYVSCAFKAIPLDMSQYKNLFNSTRIPMKGKDEIVKFNSIENRHVLVIRGGRFFTFDMLDSYGDLKSPEDIYACLENISRVPMDKNEPSVCEFTTADRDNWAAIREHLLSVSSNNRSSIEKIDSAVFAFCMDDDEYRQDQEIEGAHNFLHGCKLDQSTNRWFDKSFSIIMTKDGHAGINFEHSWGDGVAVLRFFTEIYNDTTKNPFITSCLNQSNRAADVQEIKIDLDEKLKSDLKSCRSNFIAMTQNLELTPVRYTKLDRNYFKAHKLSPDSMLQLAFQLGFYRIYNETPVSYESCSTAAFRGGRTETVRPATLETAQAVLDILESKKSYQEIRQQLQKCSSKHFQLCKEASMGQGFDRHLFAMKELCNRSGAKLPSIYLDPNYVASQHFTLSTSTLYGDCFSGGGFAPVAEDGFGLGYGYVDESFGTLVSSYKSKRNGLQFGQALEESLDDIRKIVEKK